MNKTHTVQTHGFIRYSFQRKERDGPCIENKFSIDTTLHTASVKMQGETHFSLILKTFFNNAVNCMAIGLCSAL